MTGWARATAAVALVALPLAATETPAAASGRPPFVRVVGTAQDGGFPHAACEHEGCRLAREGDIPRRLVSSLAIVLPDSGAVYLIDATPDLREQLDLLRDVRELPTDRVDRAPLDGIFLTHAHMGHYTGLAFLGFEAVHTSGLPVWATARLGGFLAGNGPWSQLVELGNIELRQLVPDEPVELGEGVSVTAFPVPHRDEFSDTVAFVIAGPQRRLLFVPDTDKWSTWSPSLLDRLEGVDIALVDGSFYSADELPGRSAEQIGHPMIGTTMDLLETRSAGGLEVQFIHLNHSNPALIDDSPERLEIERRGFSVARDGAEFDL